MIGIAGRAFAERALWVLAARSASRRAGVEAEVTLHLCVPGFVVLGAPGYPLFVGHGRTPGEEARRVGARRVSQLPIAAFDGLVGAGPRPAPFIPS